MNLVCLCVCVSTYFSVTKSPSFMKFWLSCFNEFFGNRLFYFQTNTEIEMKN